MEHRGADGTIFHYYATSYNNISRQIQDLKMTVTPPGEDACKRDTALSESFIEQTWNLYTKR